MTRKRLFISLIVVLLATGPGPVGAQNTTQPGVPGNQTERIDWNARAPWAGRPDDAPPEAQRIAGFRIFDNVYYVGLKRVSAYLVSTTAGLVLIDTGFPETTDFVLDNIRAVGFDPANIKYIFITHSHADHYGSAAKIQRLSGARVGMSVDDWQVVEREQSRARTGPQDGELLLRRDLILKDGETLRVGDTSFRFYVTPGHTPGATSIEFGARDRGASHRTLMPGGLGMQYGREWSATFIRSMERLQQLGPWDVILGNHPFLMPRNLFDIQSDLAKRGQGPHPGVLGAAATKDWLGRVIQTAREKLASEQPRSQ
jgi:metallo-beta-lactamase class B